MIIYYTGTGNSRYLARILSKRLNDQIINATDMIKENKCGDFQSDKPYVFVCPTYAWQIPRVFEKFIKDSKYCGNKKAYFILNCGGDIGNAGYHIKKLCKEKNFQYKGVASIIMPENYIAIFSAPSEMEEQAILQRATQKTKLAAKYILTEKSFPSKKTNWLDKRKSGIINTIFYKYIISDKKFYVTDNCISCGNCEKICPLHNIKLTDKKPIWNGNCTHCMACIGSCPTEAIEYGKHTKGLRRYYLK